MRIDLCSTPQKEVKFMATSENNLDVEAKARAVETVGKAVAGAAVGSGVAAAAATQGAVMVGSVAAHYGAAAGITGLTAHLFGLPIWLALMLANPVTIPIAAAVGAAVGGLATYKLTKKLSHGSKESG